MNSNTATWVITGANTGIGKVTATQLARDGHHVILACRSREKAEAAVAEIKTATGNDHVEQVSLDLSSFASVRACATALSERGRPIQGLINNAGHVARGLTADGFELVFGTNHLGHYLFTRLLLPRLLEAKGPRVVNVASDAHFQVKNFEWEPLTRTTETVISKKEYEVSKLANVLFTRELARRMEGTGLTTYAVNPGRVATDVWRRIPQPFRAIAKAFMISPEAGARSTLYTATNDGITNGAYFNEKCREEKSSRLGTDDTLAHELWVRSAEWTGLPRD